MTTVFASLAVSLDGFIASKTGDLAWLNDALAKGEDYGFEETTHRTGAYIMGANSYREMLKFGMAGGKSKPPTYVVTHEKGFKESPQTHFYDGDLTALVEKVKSETKKDIYVWGGGNLITQLVDRDLLDELDLAVIPVLLGGGVPLFGVIRKAKKLELCECKRFEKSGILLLKYKILSDE
jgi:dihydrofolate reductase